MVSCKEEPYLPYIYCSSHENKVGINDEDFDAWLEQYSKEEIEKMELTAEEQSD